MADVHRLPEEQQVLQEASEWMARLRADEVTAEDRASFEEWRQMHPLHARTFADLAHTWDRFAAKRTLVHAVAFGRAISEESVLLAKPSDPRKSWHRVALAAGVVAIALSLGWLAYLHWSRAPVYSTAVGEHATISLADGSTLELDSDSRARVAFSPGARVVHLDRGEAYFKVVHDPRRPFWVVGGGIWVRDVGTAFNVDIGAFGAQVTVSEGRVQIGSIAPLLENIPFESAVLPEEPALSDLSAGHQADLRGVRVDVRPITAIQLARIVSWRAGTLYFENQPLSQVVEQLRRYTPLHIVISDPHLRELAVAGTFEANPSGVQAFLTMLSQGLGLKIQRNSTQVVISSAATTAD